MKDEPKRDYLALIKELCIEINWYGVDEEDPFEVECWCFPCATGGLWGHGRTLTQAIDSVLYENSKLIEVKK